jgi:hypothetical protein
MGSHLTLLSRTLKIERTKCDANNLEITSSSQLTHSMPPRQPTDTFLQYTCTAQQPSKPQTLHHQLTSSFAHPSTHPSTLEISARHQGCHASEQAMEAWTGRCSTRPQTALNDPRETPNVGRSSDAYCLSLESTVCVGPPQPRGPGSSSDR